MFYVFYKLILFEYLLLEGAQAGLSWYTVLKKRENYRQAFDHFLQIKFKSIQRLPFDTL